MMYRNRMRCLYLKQVICRILPQRCFVFLYKILRKERRFGTISFAQEGEDRVLQRFLCDQKKGFLLTLAPIILFGFQIPTHFIEAAGMELILMQIRMPLHCSTNFVLLTSMCAQLLVSEKPG